MLDVQTKELPVKVPSSASLPVPLKVIVTSSVYELPPDGPVIFAVGSVFVVVVVVLSSPPLPPPEPMIAIRPKTITHNRQKERNIFKISFF